MYLLFITNVLELCKQARHYSRTKAKRLFACDPNWHRWNWKVNRIISYELPFYWRHLNYGPNNIFSLFFFSYCRKGFASVVDVFFFRNPLVPCLFHQRWADGITNMKLVEQEQEQGREDTSWVNINQRHVPRQTYTRHWKNNPRFGVFSCFAKPTFRMCSIYMSRKSVTHTMWN